jgi:sugar (pentulose or hexulose) kinase
MAEALIGLDLGTTVCKGMLVVRELNIRSRTAEQIEPDA